MWWLPVSGLLAFVLGATDSQGARILGIFPTASISHQLPYQALMTALAARGHQVTVLSTDPLKTAQANYTDIDLSFTYDYIQETQKHRELETVTPYIHLEVFEIFAHNQVELQLSSEVVQKFIKSNPKFDLVFTECLFYQAYHGLIHHVGSPPIIGIISLGQMAVTYDILANPSNPSYDPDLFWPYDDRMSFLQRFNNIYFGLRLRYMWYSSVIPEQEKIMRKYFGDAPPTIMEMEFNHSLVMVNNHWSMSYPRPLLPNFIELGSLHLNTKTTELPKDLSSFLDGAEHGFIYFSLGSNVRSDRMSAAKRQHFLDAFAELPQRVLWKWETEEMPGKPANVRLYKWLPQTDVLAHPKIRAFVTQGGLQSMGEAVHYGVPMVGMPFMGDQTYNVQKMVSAGIGIRLDFDRMTTDTVLKALRTVIDNSSYRANLKKMAEIIQDQPESPLERAVWWTEYLLRHQGAPHLRSAVHRLAWYQYLLLDVYLLFATLLVAGLLLVYFAIKMCIRLLIWLKNEITKLKND